MGSALNIRCRWWLGALTFAALWPAVGSSAGAETVTVRTQSLVGTNSAAARKDALETLPMDKLDQAGQAKVRNVLANVTIFRRLPVQVIDCDPDIYLFAVRHPDAIVSIWETLKLSQLKLRQADDNTFRAVETDGTTVSFEYLYQSHDTHIIYAEGTYTGALLQRSVKGSCLVILRTGYVRGTDGRYFITSRIDSFLNVEPGAIEIVTKTIQPLAGRVADNNFIQTIAFLGSLSRTAEVNHEGVQRLAARLEHVRPEVREELAALASRVAQKSVVAATSHVEAKRD
jgi:hypothetical protein